MREMPSKYDDYQHFSLCLIVRLKVKYGKWNQISATNRGMLSFLCFLFNNEISISIKIYILQASHGQILLREESLRSSLPWQFTRRGFPVCHPSMEIQPVRRKNFLNWWLPRLCRCRPLASPSCSLPSILQQHGGRKDRTLVNLNCSVFQDYPPECAAQPRRS